jgi:diadenosine tetraphosphate (Ap4A) HIT family hydrolase
MPMATCSMCAEIAGRIAVPGGVIHEDEFWIVSHHTRPFTDPGELMVKARRHSESVGELTPSEAVALGPVLRAAVAAIELRRWGVARNPTAAARAEVVGRIREDPAWKTLNT